MFEEKLAFFAYYPLTQTRRIEFGASTAYYHYRYDQYNTYYDDRGYVIGTNRHKLDAPPGFPLQELDAAYVFDDSQFGMTAPVIGQRYRVSATKFFGKVGFISTTVDYRKYFYIKPFTIAFRAINLGRWGKNADQNLFYPLIPGISLVYKGI